MRFISITLPLFILTLLSGKPSIQQTQNEVKIIGEMKNVMWKGQLDGNILLDTIANKINLYGLGPIEYLSGEILILNGIAYQSMVLSDTIMKVVESYQVRAPFFAYSNIPKWTEQLLPDSILTLQQLERYLDQTTKSSTRPFMFKLSGTVDQANIHIVNLPKGAKVSSPDEAHQGKKNYKVTNEPSEIVGFFSTNHKSIFTHHDTFLHMHLITADKQKMGHLDKVHFAKGSMKLYLPTE